MGDETVKVVVRARPFNSQEIKDNRKKDIEVNSALGTITITNPAPQDAMGAEPKTFSFDSVYDDESTQRAVYDETAFPLVESVLAGYNGVSGSVINARVRPPSPTHSLLPLAGTIFAYGQVMSGCWCLSTASVL